MRVKSFFIRELLFGAVLILMAGSAVAEPEQRCNELGANCICAESLDDNDLPNPTPNTGKDYWHNPSSSQSEQCGSGSVMVTAGSASGGMQTVRASGLPSGSTVDYVYRHTADGVKTLSGEGGIAQRSPGRVCLRYYYRMSSNYPRIVAPSGNAGSGECRRYKMSQFSGSGLWQMAWHSGGPSFNTAGGGVHISGDTFKPSDCQGSWCRVESCLEGGIGSNPGATRAWWRLTSMNGKDGIYAQPSATGAADSIDEVWFGDLYTSGDCNGYNGSYSEYTHALQAEWPNGNGQWIGPAYEVEGSGGTFGGSGGGAAPPQPQPQPSPNPQPQPPPAASAPEAPVLLD